VVTSNNRSPVWRMLRPRHYEPDHKPPVTVAAQHQIPRSGLVQLHLITPNKSLYQD